MVSAKQKRRHHRNLQPVVVRKQVEKQQREHPQYRMLSIPEQEDRHEIYVNLHEDEHHEHSGKAKRHRQTDECQYVHR